MTYSGYFNTLYKEFHPNQTKCDHQ